MKTIKVFVGMFMVTAMFVGCKTKSEEGGRAGDDTFKIVVPAMATNIKQGELQTVQVTLERGKGFKQPVTLEMKAPAGLQIEPRNATVQPGDKADLQVQITAAKDAALGEHKIMVKGTPGKGESTETEFNITISAP